jgi:N-acetylneuraminate synthase
MSQLEKPPQFIAEISANHLGSLERAKDLVRAAAEAGATYVKFQTYTADTMTLDHKNFAVSDDHELWGGRTLYNLYEEAHTPWEWHAELFELARSLGVTPFSSPFDSTAVDFLEELNVELYKIASLETGDFRLIRKVAETGKPIIISTGATEYDEIRDLVTVVRETGNLSLTLLVCTSSYPSRPIDAHLRRIKTLKEDFGLQVGLSDHTLGIGVSLAAIALGASIVEKHLTLRRSDGGADGAFSMEPSEFGQLVREGKSAYESLGHTKWQMQAAEQESRRLKRSLFIVRDVKAGEKISHENVRAIRPNGGFPPKHLDGLLGKKFSADVVAGTPMSFEFVDKE